MRLANPQALELNKCLLLYATKILWFGLHRSTSRTAKGCGGVCQDYVKGWRSPLESGQTLFPILFRGSLEIGHGP